MPQTLGIREGQRRGSGAARLRGSGAGVPLAMAMTMAMAMAPGCEDDMSAQPRYNPLASSALFADARSARPPVPGTVHREESLDPASNRGVSAGRLLLTLPVPLSRELLLRGQERFNIFCAPCHSPVGDGDGMVVRRGFRRPPSFHEDRLRLAPLGHFFEVITNGIATMPRYGYLISPRDRWAIAAYIRVLQHSQRATLADVPPDRRRELEKAP